MSENIPHSLGGFRGAFESEHGRKPTEQEIWNAAIRSWRDITRQKSDSAKELEEVIADLLMYAGDNGYSHIDYADTMRHAAAPLQSTALPERDHSKPAEAQGLFHKFNVTRVDGSDQHGGKHHGCEYFVLDVDHDPHAKAALQAYAVACAQSHPQLSADLIARHGGSALIDAVIRKVECLSETVENCTAMTIINALEEMKASPAALPVGELTAWIATKDQYPPEGVRVFWLDENSNRVGYDTWAGGDYIWSPTHWMHIPATAAARSQPTTEESLVVAGAQPVREPLTDYSDTATIAGLESSVGHLSVMVDELRLMLGDAMNAMTELHSKVTPDEDTPNIDGIVPAAAYAKFVNAHADLLYRIHHSPHAGQLSRLPAAHGITKKGE